MMTLFELIERNNNAWDSVEQALIVKGQDVPAGTPVELYADKIMGISGSGGSAEWQPHPDWWDIEAMVNTGVVPWLETPLLNVRYGYVLTDSADVVSLVAGYEYYTSDGAYYANGGTHTWNRSKDKPCSEGYNTRAVIVCKSANRDVAVDHAGANHTTSLYVYFGNCNITSILFGSSTTASANTVLQSVKFGESASITNITNSAFLRCRSLQSITIPNSVTSIGSNTFYYCYALRNITIPNSVASISGNAFNSCYSLTNITIPDGVTSMGGTIFNSCYSLQSITIPNSVTSINDNTLQDCLSLISVNVEENFNSSLNVSASAYMSVSSLEDIINKYADRSSQTALTFTIGAANKAKLSAEILAVAASKNITIV